VDKGNRPGNRRRAVTIQGDQSVRQLRTATDTSRSSDALQVHRPFCESGRSRANHASSDGQIGVDQDLGEMKTAPTVFNPNSPSRFRWEASFPHIQLIPRQADYLGYEADGDRCHPVRRRTDLGVCDEYGNELNPNVQHIRWSSVRRKQSNAIVVAYRRSRMADTPLAR